MISKQRRLGWTLTFVLLTGTMAHSELAAALGISSYYLFWIFLLGVQAAVLVLLTTCNERRSDIALGVLLLGLFSVYILTLRQQYASNSPAFGLDTYYEIGAIKIIQQTGFQAAASSPFPEVTDFPLIHVFAFLFGGISNTDVLMTASLLIPILSLLSLLFFGLGARELGVHHSTILTWSFAFVGSTQFFILYFGRPIIGMLFLTLLVYLIIKSASPTSLQLSIIMIVSIFSITLSHQVAAFAGLLLMASTAVVTRVLGIRTAPTSDSAPMFNSTLIFSIVLVSYWVLITISIPEWAGKLAVLLLTPPVGATGFVTSLRLRSGYVLQLATLGVMGAFVLRQILGRGKRRSNAMGPAFVLVSGIMVVLSLNTFAVATGLSVARYLLFIQFFVIIGFLTFLKHRNQGETVGWQRCSACLVTTLLVSNLLLMPAYMADASAPPAYSAGEIRLILLRSEVTAMKWLPPDARVLGDHHVQMARLYVMDDFLDPSQSAIHNTLVNESLIADGAFPGIGYNWFVFEQEYRNRILDRSNNSLAQMSQAKFEEVNGNESVARVYDNGFVVIFYSP